MLNEINSAWEERCNFPTIGRGEGEGRGGGAKASYRPWVYGVGTGDGQGTDKCGCGVFVWLIEPMRLLCMYWLSEIEAANGEQQLPKSTLCTTPCKGCALKS